ncbi:hypothetical protein IQ06DRAFT_248016 [Phaeosphaeriaceae sp. SRC1lsM3a]|nr:hypothetical protein IQ06DRAFT_248016 [Stagonospora sp. SRC1lsM3a]
MASEKQQYQSVPSSESFVSDDDDQSVTSSQSHERNTRARRVLWSIAQVTVVLVVIVQSIVIGLLGRSIPNSCQSAHGMPLHRTEPRTIYQHSKYVSSDEDEASEAWESILAGHGVVAIEPEYAAAKSLPNTVVLPNSGGKLTYVIEAYHAIHCIAGIRKHYMALDRNETKYWSSGHDRHCFDALRQYVMCNIDDTLLKTWGHRDAGHDQEKKCHDWDRLRQWAEERSANYFDYEPGMGTHHLDNYHEGDGLPVGSLS